MALHPFLNWIPTRRVVARRSRALRGMEGTAYAEDADVGTGSAREKPRRPYLHSDPGEFRCGAGDCPAVGEAGGAVVGACRRVDAGEKAFAEFGGVPGSAAGSTAMIESMQAGLWTMTAGEFRNRYLDI